MSGLIATAKPRRIKASHRRRRKAASGQSVQRYYDPQIGRTLSVDPVTAYDNGDMRFFSRYAYAFNNPYKFTDPDGRMPDCTPNCTMAQVDAYTGSQAKAIVAVPLATAAAVATGVLTSPAAAAAAVGRGLQLAKGALTRGAGKVAEKATEVSVRATAAAQGEAAMVLEAAGVSPAASAKIASQVVTVTNATEATVGAVTAAAGVSSPASSMSNYAGSKVGEEIRKELDDR